MGKLSLIGGLKGDSSVLYEELSSAQKPSVDSPMRQALTRLKTKAGQAATKAGQVAGRAVATGVKKAPKAVKRFGRGMEQHGMKVGVARAGVSMLKAKRAELKQQLGQSQQFVDDALVLAERNGWEFDTDADIAAYIDALTEAILDEVMVGMSPIGTILMAPQTPGPDRYPGMDMIATDGQRAGPRTQTQSAEAVSAELDDKEDVTHRHVDDMQTRGPDNFPALSYTRTDGQRAGPKAHTRSAEQHHPVSAESLHAQIYNSLAGKRVRESVDMGRSPYPMEIKEIAEGEGFSFGNPTDVENFMKLAICEKLYPVTGPTKHANQMKGDGFPALSTVSKEMQRLGPKDTTTGQNKTGARAAKLGTGTAPRTDYKKDGPKGSTRQFEQTIRGKVCPVCNQKNQAISAYCGACGAVLPPRPEDTDGGIPVKGTTGGKRNWNVETDGGVPKVRSPYGGAKNKHYYLTAPPKPMKEDITEDKMPESSRMVLYDMLKENLDYTPYDPYKGNLATPSLAAVNAKAASLGLSDITQGELDNAVGLLELGENVGKVRLYTGVPLRLTQAIANMLGVGSSHGVDLGLTDYVAPATLHPAA